MTSTNEPAQQSTTDNNQAESTANNAIKATPNNKDAAQNTKQQAASTETKEEDTKPKEKAPIPQQPTKIIPVDITISGKVYTINCPADEQDELKAAASYINHFIQDIRKQSPHLTHENLLVLSCLNLYEQMQETQKSVTLNSETTKQAHTLVDKMIKDMQIV